MKTSVSPLRTLLSKASMKNCILPYVHICVAGGGGGGGRRVIYFCIIHYYALYLTVQAVVLVIVKGFARARNPPGLSLNVSLLPPFEGVK